MNNFQNILEGMAGRRVLVVGDVMLDHFVRGEVNRISPEAPVPVVRVTSESDMPGAAANVAMNLASLGAVPVMVGAIGNDADGSHLKDLLTRSGVDCSGLIVSKEIHTTRKVRIIARSQHVVRVDWDGIIKNEDNVHEKLYNTAKELSSTCDVLILQDYNKGLCDKALNETLSATGKPLLVDPNRYCKDPYSGTFATPNLEEALILSGYTPKGSPVEELDQIAQAFFKRHNIESLVITLSEHGIALCERSGSVKRAKAATLRGVFDVSGAGDTVVAVLGAALAAGASPWDACKLANVAGGIVVGKSGTASTTIEELRQNLPSMEN